MSQAFTAGVKPGGLNASTQIRILLCYLIKTAGVPLTPKDIELALIGEQLVNYFELADALGDLEQIALATLNKGVYVLTEKGSSIADSLITDVPKSVRDCALAAVVKAQRFTLKEAQHKAEISSATNGFYVNCKIEDMGETVFSLSIYMPDMASAEFAKRNFIENGDKLYTVILAGISGNTRLAAGLL